ncbi:type I-E CRISPR-associated protein Cse2/CasB [Catellatospora sp. KI3]|uniref:type I-E CRISPR-associated protein Cse2/CasB n=1 Tax=Catellatospora sp. KI3 TaxID=3041620 RepID=UPI002482964C|nr:type I-E CRISPR-associated protein Cse2/CasB [Catellatospora sp. KI3]MDI1461084.1 type I-E CRISPR-associated protein Cse2/CasB [Catellatospora sp. KI3]
MTTAVPVQRADPDRPRTPGRPRGPLGEHVAATIGRLQSRLLADTPQPEAVSALARLRRGIGREPGFDYTLERYLAVPEDLLDLRRHNVGEATDAEHAAHDAITLYALHQQSRRQRMHMSGRGLGRGLADLIAKSGGPDGVRRRFAALGTATTYAETIHHLRSLITMLREHEISLDYGLLADDLRTLRLPGGRTRMQGVWGREFFRSRPADLTDTDATTTTDATDTEEIAS